MTKVDHMHERYDLRPRPTGKKVNHSASYCVPESRRYTLYPHANYQKKQRGLSIPYLSPEIVFNILVYLPADILYNVMKYVCKEWYNIISSPTFIDAHLQKVKRGILIRLNFPDYNLHCVEMAKHDLLEIIELDSSDLPTKGFTSCNGLVLMAKGLKENRYVANLVTKEVVTLPPPLAAAKGDPGWSGMGYTSSKKYKLVEFYFNHQMTFEGGIMTLGVDKEWRCLCQLNGTWKFEKFGVIDLICNKPIASTDAILHWTHNELPLVLNLDLEKENFYICATPKCSEIKRRRYLRTGHSLCFMDPLGKFSWEFWLLKDSEAGEWTKMANIDLGHQEQMLRRTLCPPGFQIVPVDMLKDGEIVVLYVAYYGGISMESHPSRNWITYNVRRGVVSSFRLEKGRAFKMNKSWRCIPHVKTLVSPNFSAS